MKTVYVALAFVIGFIGTPAIHTKERSSKKNIQEALSAALKTNEILQKITLRSMKKKEKEVELLSKLTERYQNLKENEKLLKKALNEIESTPEKKALTEPKPKKTKAPHKKDEKKKKETKKKETKDKKNPPSEQVSDIVTEET